MNAWEYCFCSGTGKEMKILQDNGIQSYALVTDQNFPEYKRLGVQILFPHALFRTQAEPSGLRPGPGGLGWAPGLSSWGSIAQCAGTGVCGLGAVGLGPGTWAWAGLLGAGAWAPYFERREPW